MLRLTTRIARTQSARVLFSHGRTFSTTSAARRTVGIDLGTTNSCAALIEGDQPIVIENDGKRTTPSIFAIDKDGNRLIGLPAQRQMVINPSNTFFGVKRLIGRRYDDDEVKEYQKQVPYAIKRANNGDAWVGDSNGKLYAPSEIASFILQKLKEVAEQTVGEPITSAVITVPAYFDNHQRQATEDAGVIAGFTVERIINEPTAAALAYGILKDDEDKNIVVYDLGGGTFDVSILQIGGGVFEVKSTAGDTFLGGEDFNNLIANYVAKEFQQQHKVDLTTDKVALQRVREASELAKHDLSTRESVNIDLPYLINGANGALTCNVTITRKQFEELALPLVQKSLGPCQKALSDAGMTVEEVSDVIMVGGMTRMPLVRKLVSEFFKKEPSLSVNPDEAVAIGAALQGSIIANQGLIPGEEARELVLVDVTPLNLGIKVHSGELAVIVPSQTPIPCRLSHVFTTAADFQTEIHTEVFQGNRPLAKDNRLIGKYTMTGIPSAPRGVPKILVTFDISANGTIQVTSMDEASKTEQNLIISMSGGLSPKDIERMRKEAELNKVEDDARQEIAHLRNSAQRDIDNVRKGLTQHKSLTTEQSTTVADALKKCEGIIASSTDKAEIETAVADLTKISGDVYSAAYAQSSSQNQTSSEV